MLFASLIANSQVDPSFKQGHPPTNPHTHKTPKHIQIHIYTHAHKHTHIMNANTGWNEVSLLGILGSAKVHKSALGFEIRHKQTFN